MVNVICAWSCVHQHEEKIDEVEFSFTNKPPGNVQALGQLAYNSNFCYLGQTIRTMQDACLMSKEYQWK